MNPRKNRGRRLTTEMAGGRDEDPCALPSRQSTTEGTAAITTLIDDP